MSIRFRSQGPCVFVPPNELNVEMTGSLDANYDCDSSDRDTNPPYVPDQCIRCQRPTRRRVESVGDQCADVQDDANLYGQGLAEHYALTRGYPGERNSGFGGTLHMILSNYVRPRACPSELPHQSASASRGSSITVRTS
jgi:hypothetical protein